MECSDPWGQTLTASAAEEMDIERFCAISCRPFDNSLGGPCVALEFKDKASIMTEDGNSVDGNFPPDLPTITGATTIKWGCPVQQMANSSTAHQPSPRQLATDQNTSVFSRLDTNH